MNDLATAIAVLAPADMDLDVDEVRPDWHERAACRDVDREQFFPDDPTLPPGRDHSAAAKAKAICGSCESREACLDYALRHDIRDGIWGGATKTQRKRLAAQRYPHGTPEARERHMARGEQLCARCKRLGPLEDDRREHGTYGTYIWHNRRGEDPCEACAAAGRRYQRQRYSQLTDSQRARRVERKQAARRAARLKRNRPSRNNAAHFRWHVNRGIVDPTCEWCSGRPASEGAPSASHPWRRVGRGHWPTRISADAIEYRYVALKVLPVDGEHPELDLADVQVSVTPPDAEPEWRTPDRIDTAGASGLYRRWVAGVLLGDTVTLEPGEYVMRARPTNGLPVVKPYPERKLEVVAR